MSIAFSLVRRLGHIVPYRDAHPTIDLAKVRGERREQQFFSLQADKTREEAREIGNEGCARLPLHSAK